MIEIKAQCIEHRLTLIESPVVSTGSKNKDFLKVDFCPKWDGYEKTAVFYQNEKLPYYSHMNEDGSFKIPHEVIENDGVFYFGVFGVKGDTRITSEILRYKAKKGAITENLHPENPTPDVWEDLIFKCGEMINLSKNLYDDQKQFIEEQIADQEEYQEQWNKEVEQSIIEANQARLQCLDAIQSLRFEVLDMNGGTPAVLDEDYEHDINGGYPS